TCVTTLNPSCYANYIQYEDVNDYFSTVIGLRNQYDYYSALAKHGIVPTAGKTFYASDFKAAIKAELGIDVALKCSSGTLSEIWAWFNVQDATKYIPTSTWASSTCTTFTYPPKCEMTKPASPTESEEHVSIASVFAGAGNFFYAQAGVSA
ncbi:ribonuclease T2, partial [Martensiomyces pterosporus]